ncbi:hypothetical protein R3X28_14960 [Maribacter sp. TH_r10]|uniref:hypothetical protein n=1 Tax=Maribacter sp. TH_r10 TaxID=3082086 RepID=UPI002953BD62|nr:hypothetical protein [Maribacter sp. TH_r10]MDV7140190.1 hypothetical protein [Maribacter sp. TH_r10]
MLLTLHSKKEKNTLRKYWPVTHRAHTSRIQRFWANLGVIFRENFVAEYPMPDTKKSMAPYPYHPQMDIDKIAQNQLAYSKLLSERMNAAHRTKKKDKIVLLHR